MFSVEGSVYSVHKLLECINRLNAIANYNDNLTESWVAILYYQNFTGALMQLMPASN